MIYEKNKHFYYYFIHLVFFFNNNPHLMDTKRSPDLPLRYLTHHLSITAFCWFMCPLLSCCVGVQHCYRQIVF